MTKIKKQLQELKPVHDTPIGLIHPYWARKPLNIIEFLIESYSSENDLVADPFMGSGTTIIASILKKRRSIGSDLNPISYKIVDFLKNSLSEFKELVDVLEIVHKDWSEFAIRLYEIKEERCVERENFRVTGEFQNGKFKLILENAKTKPIVKQNLKGKVQLISSYKTINRTPKEYSKTPIDFTQIDFVENSRIAIPKGANASHFFTKKNIIFINYAKEYIEKSKNYKEFLELLLSSMIPLLRLSDKKASSQWPYWRPKEKLTSRNPIVALNKRKKSFSELLTWSESNFEFSKISCDLYNVSANELYNFTNTKYDLVITDPPYADHAPYMEYSDLFYSIVYNRRTSDIWNKEIVKTNAVGREQDSVDYLERMKSSFTSVLADLKKDGYFIFFYLDKNIHHWQGIKESILESKCYVEEVISIPKQRRSMKAVTSPGKTLDGDLIVICKKIENRKKMRRKTIKNIISKLKGDTYFERFSLFISEYLKNEIIDLDRWNLIDISKKI
jgi:hypothetical protein